MVVSDGFRRQRFCGKHVLYLYRTWYPIEIHDGSHRIEGIWKIIAHPAYKKRSHNPPISLVTAHPADIPSTKLHGTQKRSKRVRFAKISY